MAPLTKRQHYTKSIKTLTLRDFTGGWNVLDDPLNMAPRFAEREFNCFRDPDGSVVVRYGVELFVDCSTYFSTPGNYPINAEYYGNSVIVVGSNGEVLRVQGDKTVSRIWDATFSAALPGAPDPWSVTTFTSFAHFNGDLIIANGVDKPLILDSTFFMDYLQDPASGSNVNVPVAKYLATSDRYLIMAGDPVLPTTLHISSRDTSGVWYGDPDPNDGTQIDVGSVLSNASDIRGLAAFRGKLIVSFAEGTIIGALGIYDDTGLIHLPEFKDAVEQYGTVAHRSMISYGDDMLMMDQIGVPSLKRTVFTGTIRPERVSDLIDNEIAQDLSPLSFLTMDERVFAVYNQLEGQFFFFIPDNNVIADTTETTCYVYTYRPTLNVAAWSRFDDWNFTCGCRSSAGKLFFGDKNGKLWLYGTKDHPIHSDYTEDSTINGGAGNPITFDWELPWLDFKNRIKVKNTKHLAMDVRGNGAFTAEMYIDQYRTDVNGDDSPALTSEFYGGSSPGFGGGDQPFGGGRVTASLKLYAWPAKFQIAKLRFTGSTTDQLRFVSISLNYQDGSINR